MPGAGASSAWGALELWIALVLVRQEQPVLASGRCWRRLTLASRWGCGGPPAPSLLPSPAPLSRSNPETKLGAEKLRGVLWASLTSGFPRLPRLEPTFLPPHCFLEASLFLPPYLPYLPVTFVEGYSVPGTGKAEDLLRARGGGHTGLQTGLGLAQDQAGDPWECGVRGPRQPSACSPWRFGPPGC